MQRRNENSIWPTDVIVTTTQSSSSSSMPRPPGPVRRRRPKNQDLFFFYASPHAYASTGARISLILTSDDAPKILMTTS